MRVSHVIAAVVALVFSVLSQIPAPSKTVILLQRNAVLDLSANKLFTKISDFLQYPEWMEQVSHVSSGDVPRNAYVGAQFTTETPIGVISSFQQVHTVVALDRDRLFSYSTDGWLKMVTEFNISPMEAKKSTVTVTISTTRNSLLMQYLLRPILNLYYYNWATQSLIKFKMTYT